MPGTLSITKDARITPGKNIDPSVLEGKQFKFEINIPSAAGKTLKADVKNAQGEVVSEAFDMVFNKDGKREQALKDNETRTIYGLDANTGYTVTEKEIPAGFTQTNATDNKGIITANEVAHAKFENTYDVAAAKPIASDDFVKYQKVFDKWEVADAFDIQLQAVQAGNPMPKGSIYGPDNRGVKIAPATQQRPTGSFGDIVFDRPGTFEYTVSEVKPAGDAMVPGVTYSQAVYKVTVVVKDNGDGTLMVASNTMTKVSNDVGGNLAMPEEIVNKTAVFINTFNAASTSAAPVAHKLYTNNGGEGTALKSDMFTFKVESKTDGAPFPEGADPDGNGTLLVKNQGEEIPLAQATFGAEHVGNTYVYDISEVRPDEATADNNYTVNGMKYDPTVYRAKFQVTSDGDGDQARVKVAISYYKVDGDKEEPLPEGQTPEFINSYDPADVTLPSDPNDAPLKARKTLVGRDSKQDESFTFELSAADNPTAFALENDVVVFNSDASATTMTASVSDLKNGQAKDAPFEKATFTKPGTYKFNIKENAPADGEGMTYDRTTHEVTVVVTDENGVLKADVKYAGAKDAAAFTNKYEARYDLSTGFKLDVTKTLDGRAQEAGEFGFKIEGVASNTVTAAEASKRLDAKEAKFETVAPADSGVPSLMENKLNKLHFTQADAGKTFSYVLREDIPANDKKLGGVTYDETTYQIDIQVVDNANGTMETVTTITKNTPGEAPRTVGAYDSADGKDVATLDFTNKYAAQSVTVDGTKYDLSLYKVLEGRDWREGDTFHFVMKAGDHNDPGAQKAEVDVAADPGTKAGEKVPFNFGGYTFTQPGEYYYTITEAEPAEGAKIPGITYSKNSADIVVHVTDNLKGQLEAKVEVHYGTFTNVYKAELDHNAAGGLIIAKTTNGHDMAKGQFKFQVETLNGTGTTAAETAKRLGMEDGKTTGEFGNVAGKDGERVAMTSQNPLKFTQADAGKSFKFKVSEMGADGNPGTGGTKGGYTHSDAVYTVELSVVDNFKGALTLTTRVTDKDNKTTTTESTAAKPLATTIDFVNSYAAATTDATDIDLATAATKTLDGRNMKAGEFSFEIVSNPIAEQGAEKKIATGENAAADSGKPAAVTFEPASIGYDLKRLKDLAADTTADRYVEAGTTKDGKPQYTVRYTARELTGKLPASVTAVNASFDFTVTVVDNGDGTLAATANYPKGGLAFTNTYSWQPVVVDPDAIRDAAVTKVLKGNRGTDLADGEFEFRMTAEATAGSLDTVKDADGKAWPATKTGTNKADGSVDFGEMSFSAAGTYKVTIKEVKGDAAHMTYDGHEFTYTIKVTYDPSTGKLSAKVDGLDPAKATFTNVYFNEKDAKDVTVSGADKPQTSVDGKLVGVGDTLVYTIDWVNNAVDKNGAPVAANVTVTDKIPHGTEFVSASEGGKHENGAVTWKLDNQPAGASGMVTLTVRVTDDAVVTGSVENQASIQIGDNKVTTNATETFVPGKSETTHPDEVKPGETVLTYQIKFHNTDGANAKATVVDELGKGLEYQVGSALVNGKPAEPVVEGSSATGTTLTWNLSDLAASQDVVITFDVKVAAQGPTTVENQATVNGHVSNVETTPFPTKDAKHVYKGEALFDGKLVGVGDVLTFKIQWSHDKTLDGENQKVTVVDQLPTGMEPIDGTIKPSGTYDPKAGTITWTFDNARGQQGIVEFQAKVTDAVIEAAKRGEVTNIAKVNNHASQSVSVNVPTKTVAKPEGQTGSIKVGDEVVYTITYKNTEDNAAAVTITDKLPKGLTYVDGSASDGGSFDKAENKLTWKINDVKAGATGTVTFKARVNESALTNGIANTANVQLGDHAPVVDTNTTPENLPKTSTLKIGKTIKLAENQGTEIDEKKEFSFKITLMDTAGNPLNENYRYSGEGLAGGVIATGKDGDTFKLKHGQAITIQGLPVGAKYTITEDDAAGYTPDKKTIEGTVAADGTSQAAFVNTYSIGDGVTLAAEDGFKASKELVGRDWNGTDEFSAKLASVNGAPMPDGAKDGALVKQMTKDAKEVLFGDIKYTTAGEYSYTISEEVGSIGGIKYSDTIYNVKVKVTDKGDGTLAASFDGKYVVNGAAEDASPTDIAKFVNVYSAAVPQGSPVTTANLFSKVLTGRDWKKDDSFSFTITPLNGAPAPEHLEATLSGLTTTAGTPVEFDFGVINFSFDHIKDVKPNDTGVRTKEFVYEVRETEGSIPGVTYDKHVATLTVDLKDNGKGVLSATTVAAIKGQFTNAYTTTPVNPDGGGATSKGGIQIVKTLTGRPIAAGDFAFTMAPADDTTKAKFGDAKVIATNAAELGTDKATSNTAIAITPVKTGLEFTLADVGKTYTFDLTETKGGGAGYVNDETKHTLTFTTADNDNGTLSVTATLDDKEAAVWTSGAELTPVSVGFANSYSAGSITVGGQGGVALAGTKQLTGRPMVAGEFHFNVTNANDQAEPAAVVATGTNAADGTITFTGIEYTAEKLNNDVAAGLATVDRTGNSGDVYTYTYNVSEDAAKNDQGISIVQGSQSITVKVTDNRAGKLSAKVVYPEGGMVFKNAYGTGEGGSKQIALNGTKVLDVKSGNKVPDIAGKYTFTLAGSEGAPMPAKTTATNDASGNISFGEITYTMENVFGAPVAKPEQLVIAEDGADTADAKTAGATDAQAAEADAKADDAVAAEAKPAEDENAAKAAAADEPMVASAPRSKTFTYKVTENGSVAGVTNDPVATKTIEVKVTDNGDGTLTVDKQAESNKTDFTFTNTYSVKPFDSTPTGKGGFAITKTLDGRDLREGEFEFALVSQGEGEPTVVTAKNDASGKVAFPAISFNAPGEYHYRLAEVDGGLSGVTYDTTVYDVTAKVVDNGDGTLGVTWSVSKDGKALEGKEIVFANSYKAAGTSITFNAAKVLTGRELKKGEFTFELRDANGKVLQTVKNGALTEGGYAPIAFDPITYDEPGTYDYRIVEVKGDAEGITYDETVFTYHVVVTDDGNGQLQVEWTVGETGAPVFQNVFVKPEDLKPADPANPADPGNGGSSDKLVQTGDNALVGMFTAAFAGIAAIGAGFTARRKKK